MELPHRYPFRWLDRVEAEAVRLEIAADSFWLRGGATLPPAFCAEIVAQAAAALLEAPAGARRDRWLAGIDRLVVERPIRPGERLEVRVRPEGSFGGIVKLSGEIYSDGGAGTPERVAAATLLLA